MKGNILFCRTSFSLEEIEDCNSKENVYHLKDILKIYYDGCILINNQKVKKYINEKFLRFIFDDNALYPLAERCSRKQTNSFLELNDFIFSEIQKALYIIDYVEPTNIFYHHFPHDLLHYIIYLIGIYRNYKQFCIMPSIPYLASCYDITEKFNFKVCDINHFLIDQDQSLHKEYLSIFFKKTKSLKDINLHKNDSLKFNLSKKNLFSIYHSDYELFLKEPNLKNIYRIFKKISMHIEYLQNLSKFKIKRKKFIVYFLHYQPEVTSIPLGKYFSNQILAIKYLAMNLPKGISLLVKEHPMQLVSPYTLSILCRYRGFYKNISEIPNTSLISATIPPSSLIEKSLATASLSGTIAFESIIKGVPSICLGESFLGDFIGIIDKDLSSLEIKINSKREILKDKNLLFENFLEYSRKSFISNHKYEDCSVMAGRESCLELIKKIIKIH